MAKLKLRCRMDTKRLKEALEELPPTKHEEVCNLVKNTQVFILEESGKQIPFDECLALVSRLSTKLFLEESLERLGEF